MSLSLLADAAEVFTGAFVEYAIYPTGACDWQSFANSQALQGDLDAAVRTFEAGDDQSRAEAVRQVSELVVANPEALSWRREFWTRAGKLVLPVVPLMFIAALRVGESVTRRNALSGLELIRFRALPAQEDVMRILRDTSSPEAERCQAAITLGRMGDAGGVECLVEAVHTAPEPVKLSAIIALADLGSCGAIALRTLFDCTLSANVRLKDEAVNAVRRVDLETALKLLWRDLERRWHVRLGRFLFRHTLRLFGWPRPQKADPVKAAQVLGNLGRSARSAVPQLLRAVRSSDEKLRAESAIALGAIAPDDANVRFALGALVMQDFSSDVRFAAAQALSGILAPLPPSADLRALHGELTKAATDETDGRVQGALFGALASLRRCLNAVPEPVQRDSPTLTALKRMLLSRLVSIVCIVLKNLLRRLIVGV